jgi:hypothetical protein
MSVYKRKGTELLDNMIDEYLDKHPDEPQEGMVIELQNQTARLDQVVTNYTDPSTMDTSTTNLKGSSDQTNSMESNISLTKTVK